MPLPRKGGPEALASINASDMLTRKEKKARGKTRAICRVSQPPPREAHLGSDWPSEFALQYTSLQGPGDVPLASASAVHLPLGPRHSA